MGSPQSRQRPFRSMKLITGILSKKRIGWEQPGQWEEGKTMDSSRGIRQMQTFRKLPIKAPTIPTTNVPNMSILSHPVLENLSMTLHDIQFRLQITRINPAGVYRLTPQDAVVNLGLKAPNHPLKVWRTENRQNSQIPDPFTWMASNRFLPHRLYRGLSDPGILPAYPGRIPRSGHTELSSWGGPACLPGGYSRAPP